MNSQARKYLKYIIITLTASGALTLCSLMPTGGESGQIFFQVHFSSPLSSVTSAEVNSLLAGGAGSFSAIGGADRKIKFIADIRISAHLKKKYPAVNFTDSDLTSDESAASDPDIFAISDIRGKSPWLKTLMVDSTAPWGRINEDYTVTSEKYPFFLKGARGFDPDSVVTVVQTGVTAMTRAFIPAVARSGDPLSPVKHTMAITSMADIASTSNEVSFAEPCRYPFKNRMMFCSPVRFFRILEESGFDVIELTGNHNNDYGTGPNLKSMAMIKKAGMKYFGGGVDAREALIPLVMEAKGTKFIYMGFNQPGPEYAFAKKGYPGAARFENKIFEETAAVWSPKGVLIFTLQSTNEDDPVPSKSQTRIFRKAVDLGAVIAVSSSAHRAMGVEFYKGRLIMYGLGNFLFDQMQTVNHRRGMIARHRFFQGRHIDTELIPYLMHNWSTPVIIRGAEASRLFDYVFSHSTGPLFRKIYR